MLPISGVRKNLNICSCAASDASGQLINWTSGVYKADDAG